MLPLGCYGCYALVLIAGELTCLSRDSARMHLAALLPFYERSVRLLLSLELFEHTLARTLGHLLAFTIHCWETAVVPGRVGAIGDVRRFEHLTRGGSTLLESRDPLGFSSSSRCSFLCLLVRCGLCLLFPLLDELLWGVKLVKSASASTLTVVKCDTEVDEVLISEAVAESKNVSVGRSADSELANVVTESSKSSQVLVNLCLELSKSATTVNNDPRLHHLTHHRPCPNQRHPLLRDPHRDQTSSTFLSPKAQLPVQGQCCMTNHGR